jgi:peptidoglycan hydrolase CwlO-like protein
MSLFNWMWDFGQDSQIGELGEQIEKQNEKINQLEQRIDVLEDWIRYLTKEQQ